MKLAGTQDTVEKIMSLTLADFHRSVEALAPDIAARKGQTEFRIPESDATVLVRYEPLESTTLGGLLTMPRARITIFFNGFDEAGREAFLARFDQAFQRGGG